MATTTDHHYGQAIEQIVENVFQTMIGLEVHQVDIPWPPGRELITASISLTGTWKGAVLVECGLGEALLFASRMVGIDPPRELTDDVRDALGELANMVGGNLKSILPGGVELSLPSVVWGSDYRVGICHASIAHRWLFSDGQATFAIILTEVKG